ncbi:MauE/DoxX family redox-associated membrane protein [Ferruginibacter sp.]
MLYAKNISRFTALQLIPLLLILLFAYTGTSKLTGHEKFLTQLEQLDMPYLITHFAAMAVPVAELLIAFLLVTERFKQAGLWLSVAAMLFFTVYVMVILSGKHIPCSCGGVISKMSWKQHLYFNISFLLLATWALYYKINYAHKKGVSRKPSTE